MTKILLVNDTPVVNRYIKHNLEDEGFEVDAVMLGQEGIDKAKEKAYDIILLDYNLPDINGDIVCWTIKKDPALAVIPIYYISSLDKDAMAVVIADTGAQGYLDITADIEVLCENIKAISKGGSHG
ncbi:MAG: response regulator [Candidatus Omnitrophica bacterium]|nr:response regulator [Candidatus Omnitrophota bacterium]